MSISVAMASPLAGWVGQADLRTGSILAQIHYYKVEKLSVSSITMDLHCGEWRRFVGMPATTAATSDPLAREAAGRPLDRRRLGTRRDLWEKRRRPIVAGDEIQTCHPAKGNRPMVAESAVGGAG